MESYVSRIEMKEQDTYSSAFALAQIRKEQTNTINKLKNQINTLTEKVRKLDSERGVALVEKKEAEQTAKGLDKTLKEKLAQLFNKKTMLKQNREMLRKKTRHAEKMNTRMNGIFSEIPSDFSNSQNPIRDMKQKLEETLEELDQLKNVEKIDAETTVEDLIQAEVVGT